MENYNGKEKFNFYRLKSIIIQNKYTNKLHKDLYTNDIIILLRKYINNLKAIYLIYTRADIEYHKYNYTKYPDTLLYNEMKYRYSFYAIILGYIDANIDIINSNSTNLLSNFLQFRNNIISDYKTKILQCDQSILIDTLLSTPCYINFSNCFKDIQNNNYFSLIHLELMSSYIKGYKNYNKYSLYEMYETYNNLIKELDNYKLKNRDKINNIKTKKKII